jgi:hypothetical protein
LKLTVSAERGGLLVRAYDGEKAIDRIGGEVTAAGILSLRAGYVWNEGANDEWRAWGVGLNVPFGDAQSTEFGVQADFGSQDWISSEDVRQYALSLWVAI